MTGLNNPGTLPKAAASNTPYSVTVTASDGLAKSSQTFSWAVSAVSLQSPGDQSNLDGDSVSLQLTATDANNSTLSYNAQGLPSGLSISSSTGLISGTISNTADTNSPYAVTVTATDSSNYSASQSFNWTVARLALNPVDDQDNQEGAAVSLQLSATDHVGTPSYSATGLPSGLSISSTTGLISGTLGAADHGSSPYQATVTATDGSNTSSQSFVWTVTPHVALTNPGSRGNAVGDSVSLQLAATSPGGTMSYSASGLPNGLSLNSSTGLISGTPTTASATPYTVTVTANDGTSSSSQTFAWTVATLWIAPPAAPTNLDGDTVSLPLTTAYHGSGTLSYSATGLPAGLSISSTSGQISGTLASTDDTSSPYQVTVSATDGTNSGSQTFNWTVNPRVTIDPLTDQSNAVGDTVSLQVTASDALSSTLSYSATNLPSGLTISSTTGLISGTIALGADTGSPYAVTVTVTDSAGVSATQSFNWTVAHVALVNPGSQWSVDSHAVSLQLQGSDADHDTLSWTASGLPSTLSISSTGLISGTLASNADANSPYVVTVTASDGTHNTSQTFLWTVSQVALTAPATQTNTEGDTVSLQLQGLASSGSLSYSASGLPTGLSLNPTTGLISGTIAAGAAAAGPFTVDVSASNGTDSVSQTFTWTVNPVVVLTAVADQSNAEGNSVSLQVSATDSKGASLTYTAQGLPSGLSMSSAGLITGTVASGDAANGPYAVTVTASDGTYSSNETFTWTVTHSDTTALSLTNPGTQTDVAGDSVTVAINASDPDGIDSLTYTAMGLPDGLSIDPFSGLISGTVADDAVSNTPYQVTVTADDGNGQTVSQTFNWLVNAAPIMVQAQSVSAVEGNDTGSITVATFTTADLDSQASDYTATVNWGDGNSDTASVTGQNGSFTVTDDHVYAEKGSDPVSVTITDTVTGGSATGSNTATATDAALTLTGGLQLGAIQQQSASLTLATFTDGNPGATSSDYTVTIDWGDGSGRQPGTIGPNVDGVWSVQGSHTYTQDGTYTVTITLTDADGNTATATSTVDVGDVYAGELSNLTVASFTDSDGNTQASAYTATIHWGDGTQSSATVTGSNGVFTVQGSHTYTVDSLDQPGNVYQVSVSITDSDGDTLTGNGTVEVVRPQLSLTVANVNIASSLTVSNVPVALFSDPDASDAAGEFTAQINWGDGSPLDTSAVIQEVSPSLFAVLGSHTYAALGWYPITVQISQGWGGQAADVAGRGEAGGRALVLFVNNNKNREDTLRVAKWENSFERGAGGVKVKAEPINPDPDRFGLWVYDWAANRNPAAKETSKVKVSTSSDPGNNIVLEETGVNTGIFSNVVGGAGSGWLMLTSVATDDEYKVGGIANDTEGDRTFLVKLGDTVRASYEGGTGTAPVPVVKVVKLHINILRNKALADGGTPVISERVVESYVEWATRMYAQVGIRFKVEDPIHIVDPPDGVDLSDGLLYGFNAEEKALLGKATLRTPADDDIEVYYVNFIKDAAGKRYNGTSLPAASFTGPNAKYADTIICKDASAAPSEQGGQTLAHEIGHILLNPGSPHPVGDVGVNKVNLMAVPYQVGVMSPTHGGLPLRNPTVCLAKKAAPTCYRIHKAVSRGRHSE